MRVGLLVLSMCMVTACATPKAPRTAQSDEEGLECTSSIPTGSFLPEKRCTTAAERAAERRQNGGLIDARNERDSGVR